MHFDRRLLDFLLGIGGFAAMMMGLRAAMRLDDAFAAAQLAMPLSMIAGGVLMMVLSWRNWRQTGEEELDEREELAAADGRFHAFTNTGATVFILGLAAVVMGMVAAESGLPGGARVAAAVGALLLAFLIWNARRISGRGPALSIGADGLESPWYGLIRWDAIFAVGVYHQRQQTSRGGEITITWLALCVEKPDRYLARMSGTEKMLNFGGSVPGGTPFGNLLLPAMSLDKDPSRIAAVALGHKRRTGQPTLPGWRPDLDGDEVTELVEHHRRVGTFPA